MWQALREELRALSAAADGRPGFELVTVGLDTLGAAGCQPYIEAAAPSHPALIDQRHVLAEKFGVINIPSAIWINEEGVIVRPAEAAPAPPQPAAEQPADAEQAAAAAAQMPARFAAMMSEAAKIQSDPESYHAALKDWVSRGAGSRYALSADQVIQRSRPRDADVSLGHAHFEMAGALELAGQHELAVEHFRKAHELVPDSWTFRRQAWSLEDSGVEGPLARFWQGPREDAPQDWPYAGDWLSDVQASGAENYSEPWKP